LNLPTSPVKLPSTPPQIKPPLPCSRLMHLRESPRILSPGQPPVSAMQPLPHRLFRLQSAMADLPPILPVTSATPGRAHSVGRTGPSTSPVTSHLVGISHDVIHHHPVNQCMFTLVRIIVSFALFARAGFVKSSGTPENHGKWSARSDALQKSSNRSSGC
jgi:hypothetical protein